MKAGKIDQRPKDGRKRYKKLQAKRREQVYEGKRKWRREGAYFRRNYRVIYEGGDW